MPRNIKSDSNESKHDISDLNMAQQAPCHIEELSTNVVDKQRLLVERANNTFQELCKTLESEQTKLFELEEKRKKLHEEMLLLKAEIEAERQSFDSNIIQSVSKNLSALNNVSKSNMESDLSKKIDENTKISVYSSNEEDEHQPVTVRNGSPKNEQEFKTEEIYVEDHVHYIKSELQNVLTQCITEQYGD